MAYGLPAIGEGTWGQKVIDSVEAVKETADAALPASQKDAPSGVAPLDGDSLVPQANLPAHLTEAELSATYGGRSAILFVASDGDNANNGKTSAKPKATIAGALAALPSGIGTIVCAPGTITETLVLDIDVSKVRLRGDGTTVQWAAVPGAGYCVSFFSSADYSGTYKNWGTASDGITFKGGGIETPHAGIGIRFGHATNTQNSVFSLANGGCEGFTTLAQYIANAWRIKLDSFHLRGNPALTDSISVATGLTNMGENMVLANCMIEGDVNLGTGGWNFENCSIDNGTLSVSGDTQVYFTGGHLENPGNPSTGYRFAEVLGANSLLVLDKTQVILSDPGANWTKSLFYVANVATVGGLVLNDVYLPQPSYFVPQTSDGDRLLVTGQGRVQVRGLHSWESIPYGISYWTAQNYNGDCEAGTVGWTAGGSSAVALASDAAVFRSGAKSLRFEATPNTGKSVEQRIPCVPGQRVWVNAWRKATFDHADQRLAVVVYFYSADGTQLSSIGYNEDAASLASWTVYSASGIVPRGAVEVGFFAYVSSQAGGALAQAWLDDVNMTAA